MSLDNNQSLFHPQRMKPDELRTLGALELNFESFPLPTRDKLSNFTNWVRHRDLARFLVKADIYKSLLTVPGVIFEAGVLHGGGLSTWLQLGEIYEPVNYNRRVYGFDTFTGFLNVTPEDIPVKAKNREYYQAGTFNSQNAERHIFEAFGLLDETRKLGHIPRVKLIKGDIMVTLPELLDRDKSLIISLLYIDLDLYEPTKTTILACLPRMPKDSIICIDDLCHEDWPGETAAVLDCFKISSLRIERSPLVPSIGVIRI